MTTLAGPVTVWRAYWHCAACGTGVHPADTRWAVPAAGASLAVQTHAALLGTLQPFRQAAEMLQRLTGLTVSARALEQWTETLGQAYTPPTLAPTDPGPAADVLVLEADAVMTCFHDGWHEEKVAMAWRTVDGAAQPARYVTGEGTWDDFVPALAGLARREGQRRARQVVCVADGAPAIWRVLTGCYPDAFQLVDWFHVQEHLATVAAALGATGAAWHAAQRAALRTRGPGATLWALRRLARTGATATLREAARACFGYLWRHRRRLDYPTALQRGYPIGSGRIESGCKQLVQQRAKLAGMRWSHAHVQAVLTARCAFFNGDWDLACAQYAQAA
ncbi:MAG: ISKra4 family transposase [Kiritimatiellia bacterium]